MGRKVFISVLGAGFYGECRYSKNNITSDKVRFIQEATLKIVVNDDWNNNSKAYFLTTDLARKVNWETNDNERYNPQSKIIEPYESLKNRLNKLKTDFECLAIDIPDGKNEQEMWHIFDILYDLIQEGDELHLDLTHSFRYLPMLLLVFGNYVKFLKNAKVVHISYGNYEARDLKTNVAPIIDLLPISTLQDWTFAAANYLENGNVKKMVNLSREKITPILALSSGQDQDAANLRTFVKCLETVIEERRTCRGIDIYQSKNFADLYNSFNKIGNCLLKPLQPILSRIKESFEKFDINQNIINGFAAARWCYNFGMYQQAATILQENIVSWFCLRHGIRIENEEEREIINKAFAIKNENKEESLWKIQANQKEKLYEVLNDEFLDKRVLLDTFGNLTEVRNDFNHSGMRSKRKPLNPHSIIKNIGKCLNSIEEIFLIDNHKKSNDDIKNKLLINLSNHPSSQWEAPQHQAASEFGEIIDIPFPEIEPEWDANQVEELAKAYLDKILAVASENHAEPVVHLMGEYVFCFKLATMLKTNDIKVLVSTSQRQSVMNDDGTKTIKFSFTRFREY
jgi:CRISPR-associated Csx2 family protein